MLLINKFVTFGNILSRIDTTRIASSGAVEK